MHGSECPKCGAILTPADVAAMYAALRRKRTGGRNGGRRHKLGRAGEDLAQRLLE
jgi:hypothetical protein